KLGAGDVGATVRVDVTGSNKNGSVTATSAQTGVVAPAPAPVSPPASTGLPQISGTAQVGQTLSSSTGSWSGSPSGYGYQWKRCDSAGANCAPISGATTSSYLVANGDVGSTLRAAVTATNTAGTSTATSTQSATTTAAPASPPPPSSGRFGFAAGGNVQNLSSTDLARYLDGVKAANASWIRIDINWSVIQSGG